MVVGFDRFTLFPFPESKRCKLTQCDFHVYTGAATAVVGAVQVFYLNDVFNPIGAGHQPYGFDQLCGANAPYFRFKVMAVAVKLLWSATGGSTYVNYACTAVHNPVSTAAINGQGIPAIAEKHNTQVCAVSPTGQQTTEQVFSFQMHDLFNWSKKNYDADMTTTTGSYAASPGSLVRLEVGVCSPFAASQTVGCLATIEYDVMFYTRPQLAQS